MKALYWLWSHRWTAWAWAHQKSFDRYFWKDFARYRAEIEKRHAR